ncbi:MAG: ArsR family transcriptional regulator [Anaerolineae bacterium]|nr:MAG: ArsR family transcriptional regulator [Anaerolineae bacterium]
MHPTRQQILEYLERNQRATAKELSRALKVTPANVRHHLRILLEDNWIEPVETRRPRGRGRPTQVYALAPQWQADNLSGLLHALLKQIPPEGRTAAFESLSKALSDAQPPLPPERHLTHHLIQTVKCLNTMHYRARWEAHATAPRIRLNHCPYAAILEAHPELCELDAHLLSHLLHRPVRQTAKRENSPTGGLFCLFEITAS